MNESGIPSLIERNDALRSIAFCPTRRTSFCVALAVFSIATVPSLQEKSESRPGTKCIDSRLLGILTTLICSLGAILVGALLIAL